MHSWLSATRGQMFKFLLRLFGNAVQLACRFQETQAAHTACTLAQVGRQNHETAGRASQRVNNHLGFLGNIKYTNASSRGCRCNDMSVIKVAGALSNHYCSECTREVTHGTSTG